MIIVAGVPGCGKTSVIKEAKKYVDFKHINLGDVFLEEARQYGINNRDDIRNKLNAEKYKELQKKVFDRVKKYDLVDTHFIIATRNGYMHGIPKEVLESLNIDYFVLIEGSEEEIRKRREKDREKRKRGYGREQDIKTHQELNRMAAVIYSFLAGARVHIIHNEEGALEAAGKELAEVIRECRNGC